MACLIFLLMLNLQLFYISSGNYFLPDLRSSIDQIRYFVSQVVKFSRRKIKVYFNLELSNVLKIKQASIFYWVNQI